MRCAREAPRDRRGGEGRRSAECGAGWWLALQREMGRALEAGERRTALGRPAGVRLMPRALPLPGGWEAESRAGHWMAARALRSPQRSGVSPAAVCDDGGGGGARRTAALGRVEGRVGGHGGERRRARETGSRYFDRSSGTALIGPRQSGVVRGIGFWQQHRESGPQVAGITRPRCTARTHLRCTEIHIHPWLHASTCLCTLCLRRALPIFRPTPPSLAAPGGGDNPQVLAGLVSARASSSLAMRHPRVEVVGSATSPPKM